MKKEKLTGPLAFEAYYSEIFKERWSELKGALEQEPTPVAYSEGLVKPYYLDRASVAVASALPYLHEGRCLDMCAAPGGKTLVLASRMSLEEVSIDANELSMDRRMRLLKVLDEHLPADKRKAVRVLGLDAARMAHSVRNVYDRILLDAPCSSERHVMHSESALRQWTPARIKNLAQRQWALLSSAFLMLKTEGFLVYSTCALAPLENNDVIRRLLKKYKNAVEVQSIPNHIREGEQTEYGYQFLPDITDGTGPMFFSLIKKISND